MLLAAEAMRGQRSAHSLATGPVMAEPARKQGERGWGVGGGHVSGLLHVEGVGSPRGRSTHACASAQIRKMVFWFVTTGR